MRLKGIGLNDATVLAREPDRVVPVIGSCV